jgi:hypothetical protein
MAVGAVPLVSAVLLAAALEDPASPLLGFFVRKEAKGHGLGRRIEGGFEPGQSVALVEHHRPPPDQALTPSGGGMARDHVGDAARGGRGLLARAPAARPVPRADLGRNRRGSGLAFWTPGRSVRRAGAGLPACAIRRGEWRAHGSAC